jgi:hypothetical protein
MRSRPRSSICIDIRKLSRAWAQPLANAWSKISPGIIIAGACSALTSARSNFVAAVYDRRIIDFVPKRLHRLDETFIELPIYFVTANTHTHVLRSEESYPEKWEYVRDNPVRAALAKKWSDWPFAGEIFDLEFRRSTT